MTAGARGEAMYARNTRRVMHRYRAIYAPPPRRWTFDGYGVYRQHEHYLNVAVSG